MSFLAHPQTFVEGASNGQELVPPKNIYELAALTGMPSDQAERTVRFDIILYITYLLRKLTFIQCPLHLYT